jgi:hypothetical protein
MDAIQKADPFEYDATIGYCMVCKHIIVFANIDMFESRDIIRNLIDCKVHYVPIYCNTCTKKSTVTSGANIHGEIEERIVYRKMLVGRNMIVDRDAYKVLYQACGQLELISTRMIKILNVNELKSLLRFNYPTAIAIGVDIETMSVHRKPYVYMDMITDKN